MKLYKVQRALSSAPKTHGIPALAWCEAGGCIGYVLGGRRRFAHEAAHKLRRQDNSMHNGHTWHFCALSWHLLRLRDSCATAKELRAGERLLNAPDMVEIDTDLPDAA